jgi:hypothetical protein
VRRQHDDKSIRRRYSAACAHHQSLQRSNNSSLCKTKSDIKKETMAPSTAKSASMHQMMQQPQQLNHHQHQQQNHHHHLPLLQVRCEALLRATLEHWAHHLLYVRRVYPRESCFAKSIFVGVKGCRVCRHPGVISYISNSIYTAIPAIMLSCCGGGGGDGHSISDNVALSLTILDNNDEGDDDAAAVMEQETYTLRVLEMLSPEEWKDYDAACSRQSSNNSTQCISHNDLIHLMERKLRDLVLQVHGLESKTSTWTNRVTFRISLFLPQRFMSQQKHVLNRHCPSLFQNLADGTWRTTTMTHDDSTKNNGNTENEERTAFTNKAHVLRPLHRMYTPLWRMDFSLEYHKQQQQQGKRG